VTAEPLSRGRPSDGLLRAFAGDAATEALALAVAIPFLFLHATYQPTLSIGVGSTSIDATLADAAIALVVVAAVVRGRREGWAPLRSARVLLGFHNVRRRRRALARDAVAARRGLRGRRPRDQPREVRLVRLPPAGDAAARPVDT